MPPHPGGAEAGGQRAAPPTSTVAPPPRTAGPGHPPNHPHGCTRRQADVTAPPMPFPATLRVVVVRAGPPAPPADGTDGRSGRCRLGWAEVSELLLDR